MRVTIVRSTTEPGRADETDATLVGSYQFYTPGGSDR
jgi:hypothetical protein